MNALAFDIKLLHVEDYIKMARFILNIKINFHCIEGFITFDKMNLY